MSCIVMSYIVESEEGAFEKRFREVYGANEDTDFAGRGQSFYKIKGCLVTITSPGTPHSESEQDFPLIDIDGGTPRQVKKIKKSIESTVGFELKEK